VWWDRVADLVEGAALVASVPAALAAAGGIGYVRQLVS
jgi:hypothetical protein